MNDLTEDRLIEILYNIDDTEINKEFRKGSTFYATARLVVRKDYQEWIDFDISSLISKRIVATGYWEDYDGLDLNSAWIEEKTEEVVPAWTEVIEHPETVKITWNKI